jgi:large subunit ribosomal protein L17e
MTNYSKDPKTEKHAKASGNDIQINFKRTWEVAKMLKGKTIEELRTYFSDVLEHKRIIPFTKYTNGIGRKAQATEFKKTQGAWPEKSVKYLLTLLQNLENNAQTKQLDLKELVITHVQVNQAQKGRRRTYRAQGRITAYLSHPVHIELIAEEKPKKVERPQNDNKVVALKKISKNKIARL